MFVVLGVSLRLRVQEVFCCFAMFMCRLDYVLKVRLHPWSDSGTMYRGWQHSPTCCTQSMFLLTCFVLLENSKYVMLALSALKTLSVDVILSSVTYKQRNRVSMNNFERELPIHSQRLKPLVNIFFSVSLI